MEILKNPIWDYIQVIAACLGLVAASLFVVRYWIESGRDAFRNPFGRFLMRRKILLTFLFAYILYGRYRSGSIVTEERWDGADASLAALLSWFAIQTFTPYRLLLDAQGAHNEKEATHGQSDVR